MSDAFAANDDAEEKRFQQENKVVLLCRSLVFFVLAAATTTLAIFTTRFCSNAEHGEFKFQYGSLAAEIINISQENVKKVFGDLEALSVAVTTFALHQNATWPRVALPYFEATGSTLRKTSQSLIVAFLPLVDENERLAWEEYSIESQAWLAESQSVAHRENPDGTIQPITTEIYVHQTLPDRLLAEKQKGVLETKISVPQPYGEGPYSPVWQISPPPPANDTSIIKYNLSDRPVYKKAVALVNYTRKGAFLDVCKQSKWFGDAMPNSGDDLQTVVVQPVFANFNEDSMVVGHVLAVIPWKTFFMEILPPGAEEIFVVLSNTCDEAFSYGVKGPEAQLIQGESHLVADGEKVLHDSRYDDMEISAVFADFANSKLLLDSGVAHHCVYTISTFPTRALENQYVSKDPALYTAVVVAIFLFTSIVFLLYDRLLNRRQLTLEVEKSAARKHERLVSSLFPVNVRDQVLVQAGSTGPAKPADGKGHVSGTAFTVDSANIFGSRPIADLYPQTTVFFGTLEGERHVCKRGSNRSLLAYYYSPVTQLISPVHICSSTFSCANDSISPLTILRCISQDSRRGAQHENRPKSSHFSKICTIDSMSSRRSTVSSKLRL